jgi:hypothetical protein
MTIPKKTVAFDLIYATIVIIVMTTFFFFEGEATNSYIKIGVMGMAPIVFMLRGAVVTRALMIGIGYWLWCYFSSLLNVGQRFSTLGFLGMYIITFIVYYHLLRKEVFSFLYFKKLLRVLMMAFGVVLVAQQLCMLVGIRSMPLANLNNQFFLSLAKLPSLTLEPSHTARVLAVMALCYWRMYEMEYGGKPTMKLLFSSDMKWPMLLFVWSMLTMGSGTAFIALGILSLYFITKDTAFYIIPFIIATYLISGAMEISQFERANRLFQATLTGDATQMQDADGSGASRIIPLVNTLTKTDLSKKETWTGHGTSKVDPLWWKKNDLKLGVIEQYGIIGFIITMFFIYLCVIRRFFSIETLLFVGLLGMSVGNIYYAWGCFILFAGVRYFQERYENGLLEINSDDEK